MSEPISLIKANPLLPAEDYVALRRQGFKAIEKLGSAIWTNYNNSDPGITILEALCYAITDLAYRTGFDVKDLLAPEHLTADTWKQIFYTARQILHNGPLTIDDYRKLIVDVKGVRNAWIEASKDYEVPIWVDYRHWALREGCDCRCDDASPHVCRGKLQLTQFSSISGEAQKKDFGSAVDTRKAQFKDRQQRLLELAKQYDKDSPARARLEARAAAIGDQILALDSLEKQIDGEIDLAAKKTDAESMKILELEGLYNVMVEYEEDVIDEGRREEVRRRVVEHLFRHRNLCEDFVSIDAIEYVDVSVGASIELEEYADPDDVLAQIFFTIYKYFTPSIPFHTIDQMLAKGFLVDEIFEGPALTHGFIDSADLEKTDLFRDIRLSDIINEIADIKGIKGILYLHLPFAGFDNPDWDQSYFNAWVDELRQARKLARIQPSKSQVVFCKERELITYYVGRAEDRRPDRMLKLFRDRKTLERKYKLEGEATDFPVPAGDYLDLGDYYPVTYSLPMCYGVSDRAGLPADADAKQQAQALQLGGYLLFFEQILGGYLTQLNHLRDLFGCDASAKHTYFSRAIDELQNLPQLLVAPEDDFKKTLQELFETPQLFASRRNRFLDHLLARFGEDLGDYERVSRWLTPYHVDERLIANKIDVLRDGHYRAISSGRGQGYDYSQGDVWDTRNVSGTERRLSRLLGFENVARKTLAPSFVSSKPVMYTDPATRLPAQKKNAKGQLLNVVTVVDPDDESSVLLTSVEVVDGCCTDELMRAIVDRAADRNNFRSREIHRQGRQHGETPQAFIFELWDGADFDNATLLGTSGYFDSAVLRDAALHTLRAAVDGIHRNEGLHLVEHVLLRPKFDEVFDEAGNPIDVSFLDICLDECDIGIGTGQNTQAPPYRKVIERVPAKLCYDKMPWVLKYIPADSPPPPTANVASLLFQQVPLDADSVPLKFRRFDALQKRVRDLEEFGSERVNYEIVSNLADDPTKLRYGFIVRGRQRSALAQSSFVYRKTGPVPDNATNPDDYVEYGIERWMRYFGFALDLYCEGDPCDNDEDPYSFRATAVLPCWAGRLRDPTFRNLVEKTIAVESPAHVDIRVIWVDIREMRRFEEAYYAWLQSMPPGELTSYDAANPLVDVLNTLRHCGKCEDECD